MLDCDLLDRDFSRLAQEGHVHRFLRDVDAGIWRRAMVAKARVRELRIRTDLRELQQWEVNQRNHSLGFDDLGDRTWLVTAYLPDRLTERMEDEAKTA
jgi:hypothetical protein